MATLDLLNAFGALLCTLIALFYLFRLVGGRRWLKPLDVENEVGHGMMAVGMVYMLAPASLLSPVLLRWGFILFAFATLWFIVRFFARRPLLAIVLRTDGIHSTLQGDAIHVFMHLGMSYMFLLMSSMALSMNSLAVYTNYLFLAAFGFLTFFYVQEVSKDVQTAKKNWPQLGTNLAHVVMSAVMCWMFVGMLIMMIQMGTL